jgi:hypothetical protein
LVEEPQCHCLSGRPFVAAVSGLALLDHGDLHRSGHHRVEMAKTKSMMTMMMKLVPKAKLGVDSSPCP